MLIKKAKKSVLLVCIVVLSFGSLALGQGVGPDGPFETYHDLKTNFIPENPPLGGEVGSSDARILIGLDPSGPPWIKHFQVPDVPVVILPNQRIRVREHLSVLGDLQWNGWFEQIVTPDFDWFVHINPPFSITDVWANGVPVNGLMISHNPPTPLEGAKLEFSFDDIVPSPKTSVFGMPLVLCRTNSLLSEDGPS